MATYHPRLTRYKKREVHGSSNPTGMSFFTCFHFLQNPLLADSPGPSPQSLSLLSLPLGFTLSSVSPSPWPLDPEAAPGSIRWPLRCPLYGQVWLLPPCHVLRPSLVMMLAAKRPGCEVSSGHSSQQLSWTLPSSTSRFCCPSFCRGNRQHEREARGRL